MRELFKSIGKCFSCANALDAERELINKKISEEIIYESERYMPASLSNSEDEHSSEQDITEEAPFLPKHPSLEKSPAKSILRNPDTKITHQRRVSFTEETAFEKSKISSITKKRDSDSERSLIGTV
jgi:hypothetical protein